MDARALVGMANGGGLVRRALELLELLGWFGLIVAFAHGCTKLPGPVVPDAIPDGGCAVLDEVTADRMIATPSGAPLVVHCDAGTP